MLKTVLGTKQKMSQTFVEGTRVPITLIKTDPCVVTNIKIDEKDGYWAVQLGFGKRRIKNITKPMQGHLRPVITGQARSTGRGVIENKKAPRFLREVRLAGKSDLKVGDLIYAKDIFKPGDLVSVSGVSKGKGFAGVVKRWGFAGGPKTHGQSDRQRSPGSIGQGTTPGRVHKGKKMAGRMGNKYVTVKNLTVVQVDDEKNEIALSGPVPGVYGGLLLVKKISSGKLEELIQEAPEVKIQEVEEVEPGDENSEKKEVKE